MQTNIMGFFLFVVACSPRVASRASSFSFIEQRGSELTMEGTINERVPGGGGAVTIFRRGGKKFLPVLLFAVGRGAARAH